MKTRTILFTTLLTVILTVSAAQSQDTNGRFGFELNAGISHATTDIGDADLGTGVGFEGVFHYRILKHTGVYLGWGWKHFPQNRPLQAKTLNSKKPAIFMESSLNIRLANQDCQPSCVQEVSGITWNSKTVTVILHTTPDTEQAGRFLAVLIFHSGATGASHPQLNTAH